MNKLKTYSWFNRLQEILLTAVLISFFLPVRWNGFFVMLLIILGFVGLCIHSIKWRKILPLLPFTGLFIWMLIGLSYSDDWSRGWTLIERNLALLLVPFAVSGLRPVSAKKWNQFLLVFTVSGLTAALICIGIATYTSLEQGSIYTIPGNTHFLYNRFMHHQLTDPIGMHAVYFSLYLAFSGCWMLNQWLKKTKYRPLYLVGILFVAFLLYLMKSATISFGFGILTVLMIWKHYRHYLSGSLRLKGMVYGISLLMAVGITVAVKNKLEHFSFQYDIQNENMSALAIRLSLWECGTAAFVDEPVFGTGTGDGQAALRAIYAEKGFTIGTKNDFNVHQMFLEYGISHGFIAVLLFLTIFWNNWRCAWKNDNQVWFAMTSLFFLFSLTESTMRTQKGLLFFVLFTSLFFLIIKSKEQIRK